MPRTTRPGEVIGRAAYGLEGDVSWAAGLGQARAGAEGERRTAEVLNRLAATPGGPTVLHDLAIPIPGFSANIDHVVVSGATVVIVDSKRWLPGFYWTWQGATRRGLSRTPHVDKQTMAMARQHLDTYVASRCPVRVTLPPPVVLVWPSRATPKMRLWAASMPGARLRLARPGLRQLARAHHRSANPQVVQALVPLVASLRAG